jgi:hypothetical protein
MLRRAPRTVRAPRPGTRTTTLVTRPRRGRRIVTVWRLAHDRPTGGAAWAAARTPCSAATAGLAVSAESHGSASRRAPPMRSCHHEYRSERPHRTAVSHAGSSTHARVAVANALACCAPVSARDHPGVEVVVVEELHVRSGGCSVARRALHDARLAPPARRARRGPRPSEVRPLGGTTIAVPPTWRRSQPAATIGPIPWSSRAACAIPTTTTSSHSPGRPTPTRWYRSTAIRSPRRSTTSRSAPRARSSNSSHAFRPRTPRSWPKPTRNRPQPRVSRRWPAGAPALQIRAFHVPTSGA